VIERSIGYTLRTYGCDLDRLRITEIFNFTSRWRAGIVWGKIPIIVVVLWCVVGLLVWIQRKKKVVLADEVVLGGGAALRVKFRINF